MANELTIIRPENIQEIVSGAPQAYEANRVSRERCDSAGRLILERIAEEGMTDDLDREAAHFIEKARRTLQKMNEKRSSLTVLFDNIRKEFTGLENAVDPTKKDTVAWQLQQKRNEYAALRREEEQKRQREEVERQRRERELSELRTNVERIIRKEMSAYVKKQCDTLQSAFNYATLENCDATVKAIREFSTEVPAEFVKALDVAIGAAPLWSERVAVADIDGAAQTAKDALLPNFESYYAQQIGDLKAGLLDRFPSKRAQLEKAAAASAEGAAKIKAQMEEADRADAQRREEERLRKEEEDRKAAALAAKQAEAANLFSQAAVSQEVYTPKTKVTKKIELLNPEGILPVISFWFAKEGCKLTTDELAKTFKKQITFAEKIANCANPELIRDESVAYVDEVKAR